MGTAWKSDQGISSNCNISINAIPRDYFEHRDNKKVIMTGFQKGTQI